MLGQIVAFLAVATVAIATTCGPCYPGYGLYMNALPGCVPQGCYQSRILTPGTCVSPILGCGPCVPDVCDPCRAYATPLFTDTVGCSEVYGSCENSCGVRGLLC